MSAKAAELWKAAQERVRERVTNQEFEAWIQPVRVESGNARRITLKVPSKFFQDYFAERYLKDIGDIASEISGGDVLIDFAIDGGSAPPRNRARSPRRRSIFSSEVQLNPKYTFDTYVIGPSNHFAHAACTAVANSPGKAYNPLFIYGGVGLGKTHLMQAIGQKMLAMGRHLNIMYVSSEAFMNAFIESVARKRMPDFRKLFRSADLLLVDDVQFFAGAEQTQIEFFHTFNELFNAGKKIVLSSDHPPQQLHELEDRLRSRFECGLIVDIQPPDIETRLAIIRTKSRAMGLNLPDDVMMLIAERIRTNLRKIEGALTRLQAHWSVTRDPITTTTAKRLLGPFLPGDEPSKVTIEAVQMAVCRFFDVTLHEMTGSSRTRHCAHPRQIAAYLCRELTDASFPEIARRFGGRDHSAIHHAHKKIRGETAQNLRLQNMIKQLSRQIKNGTPPTDDADHAPEA